MFYNQSSFSYSEKNGEKAFKNMFSSSKSKAILHFLFRAVVSHALILKRTHKKSKLHAIVHIFAFLTLSECDLSVAKTRTRTKKRKKRSNRPLHNRSQHPKTLRNFVHRDSTDGLHCVACCCDAAYGNGQPLSIPSFCTHSAVCFVRNETGKDEAAPQNKNKNNNLWNR